MQEKVSIIVPLHNGINYLERCIRALLNQSYHNTEILLINDGSTDGSGELCEEWAGQYENIKVFHTQGEGVSAARNRGLEESSGAYLTFVDVDDCPAKDMIAYLLRLLQQTGCDVAGCSFYSFHQWSDQSGIDDREASIIGSYGEESGKDDGKKTVTDRDIADRFPIEILTGMEFIEKGIVKSDTRCWSKLYRRESVGKLRFRKGLSIGEDMLFLLDLAVSGVSFCRSSYPGYGYFMNEQGAMKKSFQDSYMDQITCWQMALTIIEEKAPAASVQAVAILIVSILLVVGKLALLPGKERDNKKELLDRCYALIQDYRTNRQAVQLLNPGYKVKLLLYACFPGLYLDLYYRLKKER